MAAHIDTRKLYRLPWTLPDNGISWLEPTAQCNLSCDGCYRRNRVEHKSWEQTLHELDTFDRLRKSDALSIAGGDPLLYPDLPRTIAEAVRRGYKPVVNTNGHALTRELLREMKQAGLAAFTFHVDSKQGRPGRWRGKNELELCELRLELANLAQEFEVGCSFNATTYPDTMQYVAPLARWALGMTPLPAGLPLASPIAQTSAADPRTITRDGKDQRLVQPRRRHRSQGAAA